LENGGCILTEADYAFAILGIAVKSAGIKYIDNREDNLFSVDNILDVYKTAKVVDRANCLKDSNGNFTTYAGLIGKGKIIVFPSGFSSLIFDERTVRKNFYSPYSKKETNESVAQVSKGSVRYYIQAAFENLYHHRNLPFVNLWQYPGDAENVFLFRIDTDFGTK